MAGATTPPAAADNSLAAEYEIGDTGFDPALDGRQGEPARTPAGGKEAPPPAAPAKPKHPDRLLKRAAELEIDADTIGSLDTDALDNMVYERLTAQREEARKTSRELLVSNRDPATGQFVKVEKPPEPVAPATAAPPGATAPAALTLDKDALEDLEAAPGLKRFLESVVAELHATKGHLEQMGRRELARLNETRTQQIDRVFGGLAGFEAVFGKGTAAQVKGTPQFDNRLEVLQAAEMLVRKGKPLEDAITTAAKVLYADKAKPAAPQSPPPPPSGPTAEEWDNAGLVRPTHRTEQRPKGEARAIAHAAAKLKEIGLGTEDGEDAGLPD
jgi:hypothetical protein